MKKQAAADQLESSLRPLCLRLLRSIPPGHDGDIYQVVLENVERILLPLAIAECRGNQQAAARLLGLHRNTLRRKIKSLN